MTRLVFTDAKAADLNILKGYLVSLDLEQSYSNKIQCHNADLYECALNTSSSQVLRTGPRRQICFGEMFL